MFELELLLLLLNLDEKAICNLIYDSLGELDNETELSNYFRQDNSIYDPYISLIKPFFEKFHETHIKFLMRFFIILVNDCELIQIAKYNQNLDKYLFKCCDKCNKYVFTYKNHKCGICKMILADTKLIDLLLKVNKEIYLDNTFKYMFDIKDKELKINEIKKSFSLFRLEIDLNKCVQWNELFKDNKMFILIKKQNVFKDLISVVRNFMIPHLYTPRDFNVTFDEISQMSFKKWNVFYNKNIDSFYTLKNKDEFIIKDTEYYLTQAKYFHDKDTKYNIYDLNDITNCFVLTQRYIIENCKDILNILKMLDDIKKQDKLMKFIPGKIIFLSTVIFNIVTDLYNSTKQKITKNNYDLSAKFFKMDLINKINKNIQNILEKPLVVAIPKMIEDNTEYSPEKVDEEIQKLKELFKL